ncbi:probable protein S-acyltransferase 4 [Papaver somniferum]|uniref:probable protein S-acyltransferase 4 n=1 Tax=Papaver somniferum TaxID=3469 RepID=UPI000E6F65AD|nr:probable protein S-acyltransferase 4 [Papaver somniferum]
MKKRMGGEEQKTCSSKDVAPQPKLRRLYQVWQGSNRFLCGGRMIFGPDAGSLFLTILLIGGPAITFCIQCVSKIEEHDRILGYPVFIVCATITILDLVFLFLTSGRDPGIVPRNLQPPESEDSFHMNTQSMEWVNGRSPQLRLPRTKDIRINGHSIKVKYCDTCLLYRPPRASHCSICNNCVQRFDHHCPWVGQCIGLRNYRFFFMFISSSTFLCMYVFVFSWINVLEQKRKDTLWRAMSKEVLSVVLIVYCFIAVWFVGGLTVFHFYLICTNQTTYENFRYRYDKKENPYNKGLPRNFRELFLSKIPPSLNNFREWVAEEDFIESVGGSSIPHLKAIMSSKEKGGDIEMGSKFTSDGQVPDILQSLDYTGIEDKLKGKNADGGIMFDPFFYPMSPNPKDIKQNFNAGNKAHAGERND